MPNKSGGPHKKFPQAAPLHQGIIHKWFD